MKASGDLDACSSSAFYDEYCGFLDRSYGGGDGTRTRGLLRDDYVERRGEISDSSIEFTRDDLTQRCKQ